METQIELVEETVKLPKELNEIRSAVVSIVTATKQATKDGFQAGEDIPAVVLASYQSLVKAIEGVDKVGAEVKEALSESVICASLMGTDVLKALK